MLVRCIHNPKILRANIRKVDWIQIWEEDLREQVTELLQDQEVKVTTIELLLDQGELDKVIETMISLAEPIEVKIRM